MTPKKNFRFKTQAEYDAAKDAAIEKVILSLRYPDKFDPEICTLDDLAVMFSKDMHDVKTKVWIGKVLAKILNKMKTTCMQKYKITSTRELFSDSRREFAQIRNGDPV